LILKMKILVVFLLLAFIACCVAMGTVGLPTGTRFIRTVNNGPNAYIASLDYQYAAPAGKQNNMFIFGMGHTFRGIVHVPFAAIAYAKDVGDGNFADVQSLWLQPSVSARAVAFFFDSLHVYCEENGEPGWQTSELKHIAIATAQSATWNNVQDWKDSDNVTHMVLTEASNTFLMECRVGPADRVENGRKIGPYAVKCDISVNMTGRWPDALASIFCPSYTQQHAGLHSWVGALGYDSSAPTTPDADDTRRLMFNRGASSFAWQGTFKTQNDSDASVHAEVISSSTGYTNQPSSATSVGWTVKDVGFSFLASRAETDTFYWDPEFLYSAAPAGALSVLLLVVAFLF